MGGLPLPKFQRCCFCTRKLKWACIFIVCWSMLALAHSTSILFNPTCSKLYTSEEGRRKIILTYVMWSLFVVNVITLCCSFFFFLGLFMGYRISADLFMLFGFLSAIGMFAHATLNALHMRDAHCINPSDSISHFIYFTLCIYFLLIVNSHRDNM